MLWFSRSLTEFCNVNQNTGAHGSKAEKEMWSEGSNTTRALDGYAEEVKGTFEVQEVKD